jgi:hypothetical protein
VKWADIKDMFKKSSKRVSASTAVVSPHPDDHEPADGWNI